MANRDLDFILAGNSLPQTFFYDLASENNVVLVGNRFYTVEKARPKNSNYLFWLSKKLRIEESESLERVEKAYFDDHEEEILEYVNLQVQDRLKQAKKDFNKKINYFKSLGNSKIKLFLLKEVFPAYFKKSNKDYLDNLKVLIGDEIVKTEESGEEDKFSINFLKEGESIFEKEILKDKNVLILEGECYDLKKDASRSRAYLKIKGDRFVISGHSRVDISTIEKEYKQRIKDLINRRITDSDTGLIKQIESMNKDTELHKILEEDSYRTGNLGYLTRDNKLYVYNEIPPFVLESDQGKLYEFGKVRVGFGVYLDNQGKIRYDRQILTFERNYPHPANHASLKEFSAICTGDTDMPSVYNKPAASAVAIMLSLCEMFMTKAYNLRHILPQPAYQKQAISIDEVRRKGLKVTNSLRF